MRISTAYFAGVGTVIVAVGAGLGGGYLAANISQPAFAGGVQAGTQDVGGTDNRLDGTSGAGDACGCDEARCRARPGAAAHATQPQPQTEAAAPSANTAPAEAKTANNVAAAQPVQSPPQPVEAGQRKDRRASGCLRESTRRRHETGGRRKAARRAAPALGRQAPRRSSRVSRSSRRSKRESGK